MVGVIAILGVRMAARGGTDSQPQPAGPAVPAGGSGTGANPPDLSTMTELEAADRLFNRVMTAVAAADTAEVERFAPMAIAAYDLAGPLDADGLFHVALIEHAVGMMDEALATAEGILEDEPDNLLGLYAVIVSAHDAGDVVRAREALQHLSQVYEREMATGKPDYVEHRAITLTMVEDLTAILDGSGEGLVYSSEAKPTATEAKPDGFKAVSGEPGRS